MEPDGGTCARTYARPLMRAQIDAARAARLSSFCEKSFKGTPAISALSYLVPCFLPEQRYSEAY